MVMPWKTKSSPPGMRKVEWFGDGMFSEVRSTQNVHELQKHFTSVELDFSSPFLSVADLYGGSAEVQCLH